MNEKFEKLLFKNVVRKVIFLFIIVLLSSFILKRVPKPHDVWITSLHSVLVFIFSAYILIAIFHLVRVSYKKLSSAKNVYTLAFYYLIFIIGILIIFSNFYAIAESAGVGYLTRTCNQNLTKDMIINDSGRTDSYFYFTAITFFTVGYGDICPVGLSRVIAILNAFIGNFVTVVIMVLVLSYYIQRTGKNDIKK